MNPKYSFDNLQHLKSTSRTTILKELEDELTNRLKPLIDWPKFEKETSRIVIELRMFGHDLYHHEYDGHYKHIWGGNYMQPQEAGHLQIEFHYPGSVKVSWHK